MSTKNLSRTVIEGGRHPQNGRERRLSNAVFRVRTRRACAALLQEEPDGSWLLPSREVVYRSFDDKLAPALRWLESQVGRPWAKVRSELFQLFDTRTTAGRHIVHDHMLRWVESDREWYVRFRVDAHGLLKKVPRKRHRLTRLQVPLPEAREVLDHWLGTRAVGEVGQRLHWFEPTSHGFFRQARPLTAEETSRWRSLPTWFQHECSPLERLRAASKAPCRSA